MSSKSGELALTIMHQQVKRLVSTSSTWLTGWLMSWDVLACNCAYISIHTQQLLGLDIIEKDAKRPVFLGCHSLSCDGLESKRSFGASQPGVSVLVSEVGVSCSGLLTVKLKANSVIIGTFWYVWNMPRLRREERERAQMISENYLKSCFILFTEWLKCTVVLELKIREMFM